MSRNMWIGVIVTLWLGVTGIAPVIAQVRRPAAPDISIIYWYDKTDPKGTVKFTVYDGLYPQALVRDWMAQNKINDIDSNLRGCPFHAPFRIQLSRYYGYREGTATKQDIVDAVKQQITDTLPAPELAFRYIKPEDKKQLVTEQPKPASGGTGFTYNQNAPKQVGSLAGTKWADSQGAVFEFRKEKMDHDHVRKFTTYGGQFAAANSRLLELPECYLHSSDTRMTWMGLWHQVGGKVYRYNELESGKLEHVATGTIQGDKIQFAAHRYSDGSVSDPETWTRKQ